MKVGLDFHGVIDIHPEKFSRLSKVLVEAGCEVHIMTGNRLDEDFKGILGQLGICYTHLYSLTDHLIEKYGREMVFPTEEWNKLKHTYAMEHGLDIIFDDSDEYHKHFKAHQTVYFLIKN